MRKLFVLATLALFLVVGCGKKTDPESSSGPAVSADLAKLVIVRKDSSDSVERPTFRGVLTVTNGYNAEIKVLRVEWSGGTERVNIQPRVDQMDVAVAGNGTAQVRLDHQFAWKDDAPMTMTEGTVQGTLYFRGPSGNVRNIPFNTTGALTIRGD